MAGNLPFSGFEQCKLTHVQLTGIKLGQGSYASVMEVNYLGLKCAGKKIHEVLLEQGETNYTVRHFEEECRILSTMRHPNIVQFLGVYFNENERVPILVMEFLPMNLTSCIQKHGVLPEEISFSILHDVALGMCYLHSQSPPIVHRDLSANNVLLTYNMDAKISDLGVAKMLNLTPLQASRLTQTPGTPAYMPPEVMVANPTYNRSIDEFSFGIMMIHVFCGKWPEPQCPQIRMKAGMMIPVTEAERRESFLEAIGADHPLREAIISCIHNDPSERMHANDIVKCMSEIVQKFPRDQLDLIEHISKAKESMQLRPQYENIVEKSEEYDHVTTNDEESIEDKDKPQQLSLPLSSPPLPVLAPDDLYEDLPVFVMSGNRDVDPDIHTEMEEVNSPAPGEECSTPPPVVMSASPPPAPLPAGWTEHKTPSGDTYYHNSATDKSSWTRPQPASDSPSKEQTNLFDLGDTSEQVNKENSSKGATLVRSQYDDPKITQVSKSSEGSSNKQVNTISRAQTVSEGCATKPQALPRRKRRDEVYELVETIPRSRSFGDVPKDLPVEMTGHSQQPRDEVAQDSIIYDEPSLGNEFDITKVKKKQLDDYSDTTVTKGKVTIVDSKTQLSSERHIYDIDDTDDVSSMVELEKWYFGNIDSTLARTKCKKDGDFLVRYSLDKERYVVSCRLRNTCHHCIVQQLDSGEYCVGSTASKSLSILIDYLVTSGIPLDSSGAVLRNPVNKDDRWTMKHTDFEILERMGTSYSFSGQIHEAMDKRTNKRVITRSYDGTIPESLNAFLLDVEVLKRCNQSNIAGLIGVCDEPNTSVTPNPVYTVMEHMPGGIFLQYVQSKVISRQKTVLCRLCIDVAKGLDYIHTKLSRAHADVAARNCIVGQGAIPVVKIFNLGNSMSFNNSSELKPIPQKYSLPVKWTALETYDYQRHMLSDVWSYGVLLWEVFSGGATPYPGMTNKIVLSQVREGYRMDPPSDCPKEVSRIMLNCWQVDPNQRPTFSDLISKLQAVYSERMNSGII